MSEQEQSVETSVPEHVCKYGGRWSDPGIDGNTPRTCGKEGFLCLRCQFDMLEARHREQVDLSERQMAWLQQVETERRYPSSGDVLATQMRSLLEDVRWLRSRMNDLELAWGEIRRVAPESRGAAKEGS